MAENSDFGTFGRYQENPVNEMSPAMKDAYDFTKKLRGWCPDPIRSGWRTQLCQRRSCQPVTTFKKSPR
jgi:hypothetical protein